MEAESDMLMYRVLLPGPVGDFSTHITLRDGLSAGVMTPINSTGLQFNGLYHLKQ
jgi:hypothetical protein